MSIPLDQYTTAVPASFITRAYANLSGLDLFFFVSSTNELRVKQANNSNIRTLQTGVRWMCLIQGTGIVHLYYSLLNSSMYYASFQVQNFVSGIVPVTMGLSSFASFSACYCPNSTPPAYDLIIDDGTRHTLYTSGVPDFSVQLGKLTTFNNSVDRTYLVNYPIIAIHPNDTNSVTINCQRTTVSNGFSEVGFYAVKLPGVA